MGGNDGVWGQAYCRLILVMGSLLWPLGTTKLLREEGGGRSRYLLFLLSLKEMFTSNGVGVNILSILTCVANNDVSQFLEVITPCLLCTVCR